MCSVMDSAYHLFIRAMKKNQIIGLHLLFLTFFFMMIKKEIWICQDPVLGMHAGLGSSFHFTDISFILNKEGHWQHQLGGSWSSMAANTESENGDLII